ncbi:MAG: RNA-directed DNA polymerase [Planctomycetes bacterium]|nr:RNA-directed DNA polymerase [Planctomycetota bacterium]
MRRAKGLINQIADADNVRAAYIKSCRGRRTKPEVLRYQKSLDSNLLQLQQELAAGEVDWGEYHAFHVNDPKPRTIHASSFKSRVAQHSIMNLCGQSFEDYQIFDSYACRKGKGLDAALARSIKFSRRGDWYLQLDIKKYFNTINHQVLNNLLRRRFKEAKLLDLFATVLDSYHVLSGEGVPIGNLTSQFFANHYLGALDHFVKEHLRAKRYVRYMDDFVIWSSDKQSLLEMHREIVSFLKDELKLTAKPKILNQCSLGMTFLGFRVFPQGARLSRRTRDRFRRKSKKYIEKYNAGHWNEEELARHMQPLTDFVMKGASREYRQRVIVENGLCPEARTA